MVLKDKINKALMIGGLVGVLGGAGIFVDSLVDIVNLEKTPEGIEARRRSEETLNDSQIGPIVKKLNKKYLYLMITMPIVGFSFLTFYYGMVKEKYEKRIKQEDSYSGINISGYDGWLNPEDFIPRR